MTEQLFWFALAVLPLVAIPGPDMLLCIAQGLSRGSSGVWRAVNGITLGYLAHAVLAAVGLAALLTASPTLFETVRWIGIAYLLWIAVGMLRAALFPTGRLTLPEARPLSLWRGFLTSFLNPKGLFVYLSIVPQFIDPAGNAAVQAFALSVTNAALCYVVYATVGLVAVRSSRVGAVSPLRTRIAEGIGGTLLGGVAVKLATD
jgi:threonine/homoserine/homoserine lactone efflux protein